MHVLQFLEVMRILYYNCSATFSLSHTAVSEMPRRQKFEDRRAKEEIRKGAEVARKANKEEKEKTTFAETLHRRRFRRQLVREHSGPAEWDAYCPRCSPPPLTQGTDRTAHDHVIDVYDYSSSRGVSIIQFADGSIAEHVHRDARFSAAIGSLARVLDWILGEDFYALVNEEKITIDEGTVVNGMPLLDLQECGIPFHKYKHFKEMMDAWDQPDYATAEDFFLAYREEGCVCNCWWKYDMTTPEPHVCIGEVNGDVVTLTSSEAVMLNIQYLLGFSYPQRALIRASLLDNNDFSCTARGLVTACEWAKRAREMLGWKTTPASAPRLL